MTLGTVPSDPSACVACGAVLHGRWCHVCGHDSAQPMAPRRTLRVLIEDLVDNLFSYTAQLLPTLRDLIIRPGALITAQADLDRSRYLSPIKLYLTATAVMFLALSSTGVSFFQLQTVRTGEAVAVGVDPALHRPVPYLEGFRVKMRLLYRDADVSPDPEIIRALSAAEARTADPVVKMILAYYRQNAADPAKANAAAAHWLPQVLWLLMPLHALLALPGKPKGTLVYDVLVFSVAAHAMMMVLLLCGAAWNAAGLAGVTGIGGLSVAIVPCVAWSAVAMHGFFRLGWVASIVQSVVHTVLYAGLLVVPAIAAFVAAQLLGFASDAFWVQILSD